MCKAIKYTNFKYIPNDTNYEQANTAVEIKNKKIRLRRSIIFIISILICTVIAVVFELYLFRDIPAHGIGLLPAIFIFCADVFLYTIWNICSYYHIPSAIIDTHNLKSLKILKIHTDDECVKNLTCLYADDIVKSYTPKGHIEVICNIPSKNQSLT